MRTNHTPRDWLIGRPVRRVDRRADWAARVPGDRPKEPWAEASSRAGAAGASLGQQQCCQLGNQFTGTSMQDRLARLLVADGSQQPPL